jgi:hypothetical protein
MGIQPRSGSLPGSTTKKTRPAAALNQPRAWNQKASRRLPKASRNTPTITSAPPAISAAVARSSPVTGPLLATARNCAATRVAPTTIAKRKENRVNQYAMRPAAAVTKATATAEPLLSVKGKSEDHTPISLRKPMQTAGTIATARAAASPPGTHQDAPRRRRRAAAP